MFAQVVNRAFRGSAKFSPSQRVMIRSNIHSSSSPANNNIQPPSSSINSDSKLTIPSQVNKEASSGIETVSASETRIPGTTNSKFISILAAILILAAFVSFGPENFKDTFRIVHRYPIYSSQIDLGAIKNPEQLLMSEGKDFPRVTALTFSEEQECLEDDLKYLETLIPKAHAEINKVPSVPELLMALLKINGKDGEQVILLPEEPIIPFGTLSVELYGFLLKKIVEYLVLQKGFTVVAPRPYSSGNVYTESQHYMITFDQYDFRADINISPEIQNPLQGLHVAAYIAHIKQGLSDSENGRVPSRSDIVSGCQLVTYGPLGLNRHPAKIPPKYTSVTLSNGNME